MALADHNPAAKAVDPRERNMEISKDTHPRSLNHMLSEARKIPWASTACIHECCTSRFICEVFWLNSKRSTAPVNMYVQVDHARGYNASLTINNLRPIRFRHVEAQYFVFPEDQIGNPINAIRGVNDPATA
jgi:hypothetical protein